MNIDGFLALSAWQIVGITLLLTHITIASVTIYLHRHQAHRALDLNPVVSHFFRFWLWMTTGMRTQDWVAIHRKHHAKCETEDDPHSPQVKGLSEVMWRGAELYRKEAANAETLAQYGHGTPQDWIERHLYSRYSALGISLMLVIDVVLFGALGLTVWAVQMMWIPFWAAGVINGIGHYWGYRNYECPDAATNVLPWGILIGGEELHNNHHTYASSARLSSKWWEFDIGWLYIRLLSLVGLAHVKKVAPVPVVVPEKASIDLDTLKAVFTNRFRILSRYSSDVIKQVHRDCLARMDDARARGLLKRARRPLIRDHRLIDERAQTRLSRALDMDKTLKTVYQFKLQLQAIWQRSSETQENLLQQLQDWCHNAEATGIKALQDFAQHLRGYTMAAQAT